MKSACRSEDRRRAPESNTKNGRDKAQESQNEEFLLACPPEPWRRRMPSALFRGHSVGLNSPDRLIQPIPSPGKPNAGATRPFFASLALCDFAFDSGAKNSSPSHRFAVSRSDVGEGFHLAAPLKANRARKSNLIQLNRTKSNQIAPFLKYFFMQKSMGSAIVLSHRSSAEADPVAVWGISRRTAGQRQSNQYRVRRSLTLPGQIVCKHLKMNDLQTKQPAGESNPVKVNQSDIMSKCVPAEDVKKSDNPLIRQPPDGQAGQGHLGICLTEVIG